MRFTLSLTCVLLACIAVDARPRSARVRTTVPVTPSQPALFAPQEITPVTYQTPVSAQPMTQTPAPTVVPATIQPTAAQPVAAAPQPVAFERLLALHNAERARRGRAPLVLDAGLCAGAQNAADAQAQRRACGHFVSLAGASAENCAAGQTSEDEVHSSWTRSPGHFANMLGGYSRVGFGVNYGPGGPYWAARFGG